MAKYSTTLRKTVLSILTVVLSGSVLFMGSCSTSNYPLKGGNNLISDSVLFQADTWSQELKSIVLPNYKGISFEVTNVTTNGAEITIHNSQNNQISYNPFFTMEKLEDGKWCSVDFPNGNIAPAVIFNDPPAYLQYMDFDLAFGGLAPGTYRFIQGIYVNVDWQKVFDINSLDPPKIPDPINLYTVFSID